MFRALELSKRLVSARVAVVAGPDFLAWRRRELSFAWGRFTKRYVIFADDRLPSDEEYLDMKDDNVILIRNGSDGIVIVLLGKLLVNTIQFLRTL